MAIQLPGAGFYYCVVLCEQTTPPAVAPRPQTRCYSKGKTCLWREREGRIGDNSAEWNILGFERRVKRFTEKGKVRSLEWFENRLLNPGWILSAAHSPPWVYLPAASCKPLNSCLFPLILSFLCPRLPVLLWRKGQWGERMASGSSPLGWGAQESYLRFPASCCPPSLTPAGDR